MMATHPAGRGRVILEVEWCPQSLSFEHPVCGSQTSSPWIDVTATSRGVALRETIGGLLAGELFRWRARVLHAPFHVDAPGTTEPPSPPHGPWRRPTAQAQAHEADVRPVPEPGVLVGALAGIVWLSMLHRRRDPWVVRIGPLLNH
jgi:hypothetical protein